MTVLETGLCMNVPLSFSSETDKNASSAMTWTRHHMTIGHRIPPLQKQLKRSKSIGCISTFHQMAICPALPASIWASGHKPSHEHLVHTPTLIVKHDKYSWMNACACVCACRHVLRKNKKIILYLIINLLQNQSSCRASSNEENIPGIRHTAHTHPE